MNQTTTPRSCDGGKCLHPPITSTDAKLLRKVRAEDLQYVKRWWGDPDRQKAARCFALNAQMCLERLRELRKK